MVPKRRLLLRAALIGALIAPVLHAGENDALVKSIMKLRADVEKLYAQLQENKENYKAQMKSYTMQKADMEAQINRRETALKLLRANLQEAQKKADAMQKSNTDLTPLLYQAIDNLDSVIAGGIPFKVAERRAELRKIRAHLQDKTLSPEKGLSMVWASYDDMIRLTKEIGLFKQEIKVGGNDKLAQIAKLGSVALYFAAPGDEVGYVVKKGDGYDYQVTHDEKERAEIVALFDALKKQIRTGYFTLPNALVPEEVK